MKEKLTHFRTWKSGKKWLVASTMLGIAVAGSIPAAAIINTNTGSNAQVTTTSSSSVESSATSVAASTSAESSTVSIASSSSPSVASNSVSAATNSSVSSAVSSTATSSSTSSVATSQASSSSAAPTVGAAQGLMDDVGLPASKYNILDNAGHIVSVGDEEARKIYGTDYNYIPVNSPETLALMGIPVDQLFNGIKNLNVTSKFENSTLTFTKDGQVVYHVGADRATGFAQNAANLELAQLKAKEAVNSYYSAAGSTTDVNADMISAAAVSESMVATAQSLIAEGKLTQADTTFAAANQKTIETLENGLYKDGQGSPSRAYKNAFTEAAILVNAADYAKQKGLSDDIVGSLQLASLDANNWMIFFAKDYFAGSGNEAVAIHYDMSVLIQLVNQGKLPSSLLQVTDNNNYSTDISNRYDK